MLTRRSQLKVPVCRTQTMRQRPGGNQGQVPQTLVQQVDVHFIVGDMTLVLQPEAQPIYTKLLPRHRK
jgi:hypothetical protein